KPQSDAELPHPRLADEKRIGPALHDHAGLAPGEHLAAQAPGRFVQDDLDGGPALPAPLGQLVGRGKPRDPAPDDRDSHPQPAPCRWSRTTAASASIKAGSSLSDSVRTRVRPGSAASSCAEMSMS